MKYLARAVSGLCALIATSVHAGELLGVDLSEDALGRIDRESAAWEPIGPTGVPDPMNGLAYDSAQDQLYGVIPGRRTVYRINRLTGAATSFGEEGAVGFENVTGLAFDRIDRVLYGTDTVSNALLRVDTTTGQGSLIAPITGGFTQIEGLGYDAATRRLFGISPIQRRIVTIDTATGAATAISDVLPSGIWRGLDFDEERRVLFASTPSQLWQFSPDTGAFTLVGAMAINTQGLAYIPSPGAAGVFLGGVLLQMIRRRARRS